MILIPILGQLLYHYQNKCVQRLTKLGGVPRMRGGGLLKMIRFYCYIIALFFKHSINNLPRSLININFAVEDAMCAVQGSCPLLCAASY